MHMNVPSHYDLKVGFKDLDFFHKNMTNSEVKTFPPHNIVKVSDNEYRLELAVAGFKPEHLEITVSEGSVKIVGNIPEFEDSDKSFIYKGIAGRSFTKVFTLSEHVRVEGAADISLGLLSLKLVREVPDHLKMRKIPIIQNDHTPQLDGPEKNNYIEGDY